MRSKIKGLFFKYRELITYVIAGGLTTVVNLLSFKGLNIVLGEDKYLLSNIIAWLISVIFAFVINKLWVFESKKTDFKSVIEEASEFFAARVFSLVIEEIGLWLFVDILGFDKYSLNLNIVNIDGKLISKILLAVIVVILNYFFSKLVIFKKDN